MVTELGYVIMGLHDAHAVSIVYGAGYHKNYTAFNLLCTGVEAHMYIGATAGIILLLGVSGSGRLSEANTGIILLLGVGGIGRLYEANKG